MHKAIALHCRRALFTGFFVAAASSGGAQETQGADSSSADSAGSAQELKPVRIDGRRSSGYAAGPTRSATKMAALPRDVPQSLVTVTKQLIRDQAMQNLGDVLRYVPGATMGQGEGNRDQVTIRGNTSTSDFFVDGVRDDVQYIRDLYNLERVEALKGSNAMIFGRGGGGGILNRVTKEADGTTRYEVSGEAGTFGARRVSADLRQGITPRLAGRLNSVHERSDLYRDGASIERSGFNPTVALVDASRRTRLSAGYEYFNDQRTADRGIPSWLGEPVETSPSTFFGNSGLSVARARVNTANATIAHDAGRVQLRNHTLVADYDKFYQNVFPGPVSGGGSVVSISGYNNQTNRTNLFNQTDLNLTARTGDVTHELLFGAEIGRQSTDNFRNTAYFEGGATSVSVNVSDPFAGGPVTFRQSASDADNGTVVTTASLYFQNQVALSRYVRLLGGARYERFGLGFEDSRSGTELDRTDHMISPRAGVIVKPAEVMSFYGSYSVSFLPGSGDQFASLTEVTSALRPERFTNYEVGMKWDVLDRLALTGAVYRLDRTNTRSADPTDPARIVQTGAQRSEGVELGASGNITRAWEIAAGFASQSAKITRASTVSPAGARVPLVPRTSLSLWNRVNVSPNFGLALGAVHQTSVFASIDNAVRLPGFERFDAALFTRLGGGLSAQLNVENVFDTRYFATAHNNNNITPGSPRAARLSLTAAF